MLLSCAKGTKELAKACDLKLSSYVNLNKLHLTQETLEMEKEWERESIVF
jgi:hypothetical protein